MNNTVYCKPTSQGIHSFYLVNDGNSYFLFSQNYRKGVQEYYGRGVSLNEAMDHSRSHKDEAIMRTMSKVPMYIKYIEDEFGITVLRRTAMKNSKICRKRCAQAA